MLVGIQYGSWREGADHEELRSRLFVDDRCPDFSQGLHYGPGVLALVNQRDARALCDLR